MENRALVIKAYGNPAMRGAIIDGITREVIPLNTNELAVVKSEYARLKARNELLEAREGVRQKADEERWITTKASLAATYAIKPHGRVYTALLLGWAIIWLLIDAGFTRLWAAIENGGYTESE